MIDVTLQADGSGIVSLPGRAIPVAADTLRDAREQAIGILTRHAAVQAAPLEVQALDAGEVVRLSVHPDGGIIVHRPGTEARRPDPVGPSQVPAPMAPAEEYIPPAAPAQPSATATAPWALPADIENTVIRPPLPAATALLDFTTGESASITGTALIGRRPNPDPGEEFEQYVPVSDPARSVSKNHLVAQWRDGQFWISDRSSGNGTTVHREGAEGAVRLTPGTPYALRDGDRVQIGEQGFSVGLISTPQS